ncbi:MAG: DUF4397 domain-containing protein [Sphingobacteriales bacterium]
MTGRYKSNLMLFLGLFTVGAMFSLMTSSCGKQNSASPSGLNIQYRVFNLSPDLGPINLFINYNQVNASGNPFIFGADQGYFHLPSIAIPFQFRLATSAGTPILPLNRSDILVSGAKYSLFISGSYLHNTLYPVFTVDTDASPATGRGKLRFVDASPSATSGLDVYANDTLAFKGIIYKNFSKYIELPVGNYDIKIKPTGLTTTLSPQLAVTIQDGRLYTIYAYGSTTAADSSKFNAAIITNK